MLIVGAKGFAKEVLEVVYQNDMLEDLVFFDDVNVDVFGRMFNKFPILKNVSEVQTYFKNVDSKFTLGIGKPNLRLKLFNKFTQLEGIFTSTISSRAKIGHFDVTLGNGCNILDGAIISNSVSIGIGTIIYYNSIITHDCIIGNFVEVSPNVSILGRVKVGDLTQIGTGAIILPDLIIGSNVIIGAGAVVTKDIPDYSTVVGIPAKVIKSNNSILL